MKFANKLFGEIFQEFDQAKTREARIAVLRKYEGNRWFVEFLNYAFNPRIHFDVFKVPAYRESPDPAGLAVTNLSNEMRRLYIFILGHPKRTTKLDPKKEERLLNVLLGSLHKDEAALVAKLLSKDKDLKIKYLTPSLVKEAFPKMPFELPEAEKVAPVEPATQVIQTGDASVVSVKKAKKTA